LKSNRRTVGSKDYKYAFCDGGKTKSAVVYKHPGALRVSVAPHKLGSTNDDTESAAILKACESARELGGNWIIVTDSRAILRKIDGGTNATGQPNVNGIRRILKEVNESNGPDSIQIKWMKRLSTPEMVEADRLCKEEK